jgi:SAM-dependent methyltransferase
MDIKAVDEQTKILLSKGERLFQIHRFAKTDYLHIKRLMGWADIPSGSRIIDMGCGIGEMAIHTPWYLWTLCNISEFQLECAPNVTKLLCDFHSTPYPDKSFDAVMFCFSIGHGNVGAAFAEAFRLLRSGGILFIYDMVMVSGDNSAMKSVDYKVFSRSAMEMPRGFKLDFYMEPQDNGEYGHRILGPVFDTVFAGTIPAIWRFIKP